MGARDWRAASRRQEGASRSPLFCACHLKQHLAATDQRRQRQRHPRHKGLDIGLWHADHPSLGFPQRPDGPETARQCGRHFPRPSAPDRTTGAPDQGYRPFSSCSSRGSHIRARHIRRDRVDIRRGRAAFEDDSSRHRHVVQRIVRSHKALITDEPMNAAPWNPCARVVGREQLMELFRARSTGEADRDAAVIGRDPRRRAFKGGLRKRIRIGHNNELMSRCHRQVSLRQLRPSRAKSSSASSGPSLPGS